MPPCPKTILLVEDETIIALAQSKILKRNGFEVRKAAGGREAIEEAAKDPQIDLILMDINLGRGIDGTEAARTILAAHDIPILFLSSHTESEYVRKTEEISSYGYVVKSAGETVLIASIKMALRLAEANRRIEEDSALFHRSLDNLLEGCQIIDPEYRYVYVNSAAAAHGKTTPAALMGRTMFERYPGIDKTVMFREIEMVMTSRAARKVENVFAFADGSSGWFELSIQPVPEGVLILSIETTERKKAELALNKHIRELETMEAETSLLAAIVETARIAIGVCFPDGKLGIVNQAFCDLLGYTREELRGTDWTVDLTPPEWREAEREQVERLLSGTDSVVYEKEYLAKDGSRIPVRLLMQAVRDEAGEAQFFYTFTENMTEFKKQQQERDALLREKDSLLQELQHRVKNSLNMINALLYLKESEATEPPIREAVRSVRGRIEVLTLLYRLVDTNYSAGIRLDDYLRAVCDSVMYSHDASGRGILIAADFEPVSIDLKRGANLGLVLNELLENALVFAFPPERLEARGGTIELTLRSTGKELTLDVSDDGIGMPDQYRIEDSAGFGFQLAVELMEQAAGSLERVAESGGAAFRIRLPL